MDLRRWKLKSISLPMAWAEAMLILLRDRLLNEKIRQSATLPVL